MSNYSVRHLAFAVVLALGPGCGLGANEPEQPGEGDPTDPSAPAAPTTAQKPVLDLSSIPSATCSTEIGLRGSAAPGNSVFAFGGAAAAGIATDASPSDGSFCLPLKLLAGSTNVIEVRAQDPKLGVSEPVTLTVVQKECTAQGNGEFEGGTGTDPTMTPRNVAYGASATSLDSPLQGNLGFLTDEKVDTWARWEGGHWYCNWCDYNGWVAIKLDKLYDVQKIVVRWRDSDGNGTAYGRQYKVLVSAITDPGAPDLTNGQWEEVGALTDGDGGIDTFDLSTKKPNAQHVALWLQQDGYPWTTEFLGYEEFAIADIEVWDAPKSTSLPIPAATVCQ